MSYILDALKKSEAERREQEEQQHLAYTPLPAKRSARIRSRLAPVLILSTFLLLSLLILGGGWWYLNRTKVIEEQVSAQPVYNKDEEEVKVEKPEALPAPSQADRPAELAVESLTKSPLAPATTIIAPENVVRQALQTAAPPATVPKEPDTIPFLADLPFSTRSMLNDMKFRGHVYSETPSQRMIMFNTSIAREGDTLAPDLSLEEITENGVVLRFRDTVFRVTLP